MFGCLRHPAVIGSDNEHDRIDTADAGNHVFNELFVAGNINNADRFTGGQIEPSEAQIDSQAAPLFFRQAVRIYSGKRFDQRRFAVIYMSGSAYDKHAFSAFTIIRS